MIYWLFYSFKAWFLLYLSRPFKKSFIYAYILNSCIKNKKDVKKSNLKNVQNEY